MTLVVAQAFGDGPRLVADSQQACEQQQITRGQLTVHADRGSSMTSKPVAMLLSDLGVTKTHSRPYTSTDNPYSEAQFKTLSTGPGSPPASTRSSTPGHSAASSSRGTTSNIATPGSA